MSWNKPTTAELAFMREYTVSLLGRILVNEKGHIIDVHKPQFTVQDIRQLVDETNLKLLERYAEAGKDQQ